MTATAPLSWHLAHPKQYGHGDRFLDLPPPWQDGALPTAPPMRDSGSGSILQQGHLGPRDPSSDLVVRNGLYQPVPKHLQTILPPWSTLTASHPQHSCPFPSSMLSPWTTAAPGSSASQGTLRSATFLLPTDLQSQTSCGIVQLLAVAWGFPVSWVIPRQQKPTQASLSPLSNWQVTAWCWAILWP